MYMIGLLLFPAYKQFPHLASTSKWLGIPLMAAGLIGASFAQTVSHLILTQGVLYAMGGCIIYYPVLMYIDEWFIRRKGLAYGISNNSLSLVLLLPSFHIYHICALKSFTSFPKIRLLILV